MPHNYLINFRQKLTLIQQNLALGGYTIVAKECVGLIEQALRVLFSQHLTHLASQDRLTVQQAELEVGKGHKGIEHFTMGELVGVFRKSKFLDAWARVSGKDLSSLRVINLNELTTLRNRLVHDDREASKAEAEFLVHCLYVILGTFDLEAAAAPLNAAPPPLVTQLTPAAHSEVSSAADRPLHPGKTRRSFWRLAVVVILVGLLTGIADYMELFSVLEHSYDDLWHRLAGVRSRAEHVTIVSIDDFTLLEHRDEPLVFWGPHFVTAIETARAAGASVIGLDMLFLVSAESWLKTLNLPENELSRTYDIPMRAQLAAGQVVLAGLLTQNDYAEYVPLLPLKDYWMLLPQQLDDVGLTNLYSDRDGVVRHFLSTVAPDASPGLSFAALLAAKHADLEPHSNTWSFSNYRFSHGSSPHPIGFLGPPGTIPRLSLTRLLRPDAGDDPDVQRLRDKIVIIAAEYSGAQDLHLTPYTRSLLWSEGEMMSGPELHANIVETLLTGRFPRTLPFWARLLILLIVIAAASFLFVRSALWKGLALGMMFGIIWMVPAFLGFYANWVLPTAAVQVAIGLSYLAALGFRLTGEERERTRLQRIFGQFVSDDVVDHLVATGRPPHLGGQACQVTVLFSDIRNFTTISEKLTPPEVVEMLNAYFSRVCEPILEHGGMINKFIGDAVMAVFGAPASFPDHADRALRAAVAMKATAEKFRSWMQTRFPDTELPEFRIGVGLHSGDAVVGNIGSTKRMEYTVIGDTVNIASRLESASKTLHWTIVASAATIAAARHLVRTSGHDEIHVKGREQSVEVFEVVGENF